jgi:Uma2 family endonuclease
MNLHAQGIPENEPVLEKGFEFIDGRPVEKPRGAKASRVMSRLIRFVDAFVDTNNLGHVFDSEGSYQIFTAHPLTVRKPDGSFIARGRFPNEEVPEGNITISPDLVIEAISPNDHTDDTEERIADFLGAGTKLIWIVHPTLHAVWVFRQDGSAARLTETQSLSGEDVLPGFTCPLATLFTGI